MESRGEHDADPTSAQKLELRLWRFLKRSGYTDQQFNDLPYARALQLLALDEQLRYDENKEADMRDARRGYERYLIAKADLSQEALNGTRRPTGKGKKGETTTLLTFEQYCEVFGYIEPKQKNKTVAPVRTFEEELAESERWEKAAIAMFRQRKMTKKKTKDLEQEAK